MNKNNDLLVVDELFMYSTKLKTLSIGASYFFNDLKVVLNVLNSKFRDYRMHPIQAHKNDYFIGYVMIDFLMYGHKIIVFDSLLME